MQHHGISWNFREIHGITCPQPLWDLKYLSEINGSERGWGAWPKGVECMLFSWIFMKFHGFSGIFMIFMKVHEIS